MPKESKEPPGFSHGEHQSFPLRKHLSAKKPGILCPGTADEKLVRNNIFLAILEIAVHRFCMVK